MTLRDFIIWVGEQALKNPERYLSPGHNGPYHHPETPVRISGHWLIIFAKCYDWTGDGKYRQRVADLADVICSKAWRPHGYAFYHRNKPGKTKCNGLMGQAWTFEALAWASECCGEQEYADLAGEVFSQHVFMTDHGLWKILEVDGRNLGMDMAFNHQLWFAGCASRIRAKKETSILIQSRLKRFLDSIWDNLTVLQDGLVYHVIEWLWEDRFKQTLSAKKRAGGKLGVLLGSLSGRGRSLKEQDESEARRKAEENLIYKSMGYHAFNMYAFALLKEFEPTHKLWESEPFQKAVDYMLSEKYWMSLEDNRFGYPYNPPGFEVPFALSVLKNVEQQELIEASQKALNQQLARCYDEETEMLSRDTEDAVTLTARLYEIARWPDILMEGIRVVL